MWNMTKARLAIRWFVFEPTIAAIVAAALVWAALEMKRWDDQAMAATNLSLSLADDASALARYQCEREKSGPCTAAQAKVWLEARVEAQTLAPIRAGRLAAAAGNKSAACALFNAAPLAARNDYCVALGLAAGCTPPQCETQGADAEPLRPFYFGQLNTESTWSLR